MMSQTDIDQLERMGKELNEEFKSHDNTQSIAPEMLDRFHLIGWAKKYSELLKQTNTDNKYDCISKISESIKTFLHSEGGYDNGYYTYVNGTVNADEEGILEWCTPTAKEELTPKGIEVRGKTLYNTIQSIIKDHHLKSVTLRSKDVNCGAFETDIVFINETTGKVKLY